MTAVANQPIAASDLWAIAHNAVNRGDCACHWCGQKCGRTWFHDDVPPVPFQRSKSTALCPANAYICVGCWLWRRGSVTVNYLSTGKDNRVLKDRQKAKDHSWFVSEEEAKAIRIPDDCPDLYPILLNPPRKFFLALRDGDKAPETLLQLCKANDNMEVKADTTLHFTINNIPHTYTIFELEQNIRSAAVTGGPGAQALRRILGPFSLPPEEELKRKPGRPTADKLTENIKAVAYSSSKAVVRASGK